MLNLKNFVYGVIFYKLTEEIVVDISHKEALIFKRNIMKPLSDLHLRQKWFNNSPNHVFLFLLMLLK